MRIKTSEYILRDFKRDGRNPQRGILFLEDTEDKIVEIPYEGLTFPDSIKGHKIEFGVLNKGTLILRDLEEDIDYTQKR